MFESLQKRRERDDEVDLNFFLLEQARHVDDVVGALGMTDENESAELACLVRLYDARNCRFPGQVAYGLRFDALVP